MVIESHTQTDYIDGIMEMSRAEDLIYTCSLVCKLGYVLTCSSVVSQVYVARSEISYLLRLKSDMPSG